MTESNVDIRQVELARLIATVAHGATGQTRNDGETEYIRHPARVVSLLKHWSGTIEGIDNTTYAAAWMHDVLEDTKLKHLDLINLGVDLSVLRVVDILTKDPVDKPATPEYYERIKANERALVIKAADRCSNLEDALTELRRHKHASGAEQLFKANNARDFAIKYLRKTDRDILPMYDAHPAHPLLRNELLARFENLRVELQLTVTGTA